MAASSLIALLALAGVATPTDVVKSGQAEVEKVLQSSNASVEKLGTVVDGFVDFVELAKRALGQAERAISETLEHHAGIRLRRAAAG